MNQSSDGDNRSRKRSDRKLGGAANSDSLREHIREAEHERAEARRRAKEAAADEFRRFITPGSPLSQAVASYVNPVGLPRYTTKTTMIEQAKDFYHLATIAALGDLSVPADLMDIAEMEETIGLREAERTMPLALDRWMPCTGDEDDYVTAVFAVARLGQRTLAEQLPKFKPRVTVDGKPPAMVVKRGRSTEIFQMVCFYIAARVLEEYLERYPDAAAAEIGLKSSVKPFRVAPKDEWIRAARISRDAFFNHFNLLTSRDNHELRHPIPVAAIIQARYSRDTESVWFRHEEINGEQWLRIPSSILREFSMSRQEFPPVKF